MQTLTAAEYAAKKHHNYAGTIDYLTDDTATAWHALVPEWDGKHWHIYNTGDGTALGPVNVNN